MLKLTAILPKYYQSSVDSWKLRDICHDILLTAKRVREYTQLTRAERRASNKLLFLITGGCICVSTVQGR